MEFDSPFILLQKGGLFKTYVQQTGPQQAEKLHKMAYKTQLKRTSLQNTGARGSKSGKLEEDSQNHNAEQRGSSEALGANDRDSKEYEGSVLETGEQRSGCDNKTFEQI